MVDTQSAEQIVQSTTHRCLFCDTPLVHIFADLGSCPPSNAFLTADQLQQPEIYYPLQAYVCGKCLLVQGPHYKRPQEIFNHDYVYHSSWSRSWVQHAKEYVYTMSERFRLHEQSMIIEIGSNDGYLLQHAVARGIPCLGIDPSSGAASIAQMKGISTITDFFTAEMARTLCERGIRADLVCGINVFAHVPNINNFVEGIRILLKPSGVVTMEFPHLMRLVEDVQFDTIYHEHYFYYTLACAQKIIEAHGMRIFDVEELPTHGGSLRLYACLAEAEYGETKNLEKIYEKERCAGMYCLKYYTGFQKKIDKIRHALLRFLLETKEKRQLVVGYGAAAKGNTLLNYLGIRRDLLPFIADTSPVKQGKFLPGSHIPVLREENIVQAKPEYVLILPWNLSEEISEQLKYVKAWGGRFITVIPELKIW